jgi:hypothetical protein
MARDKMMKWGTLFSFTLPICANSILSKYSTTQSSVSRMQWSSAHSGTYLCFMHMCCFIGYVFIFVFVKAVCLYSFIRLVYSFNHLFVFLICMLFVHLFICSFIRSFVYLFMCLCIYAFMCLCIYAFMCLCVYLFTHLCIYVFMCFCIYVFMCTLASCVAVWL